MPYELNLISHGNFVLVLPYTMLLISLSVEQNKINPTKIELEGRDKFLEVRKKEEVSVCSGSFIGLGSLGFFKPDVSVACLYYLVFFC